MLFDWLLKGMPIHMGLYFDKDDSGSGGKPDDGAEDKSKEKEDESEAGDDEAKAKAEKKFTQAELDQIVKDRLERERKKSDAAAEKARKEAEDAALAKNQEWQKLAETRASEIETLNKEKAELESFKDQAERYKAALDKILAERKKTLPKFVVPLIEKMDPVEAMAYITDHAEELGAKPETYEETPDGKKKKLSDEDKREAERASTNVIARTF